jgi:hypothetical protein
VCDPGRDGPGDLLACELVRHLNAAVGRRHTGHRKRARCRWESNLRDTGRDGMGRMLGRTLCDLGDTALVR